MKILFMPESLTALLEYIDRGKPVIKDRFYHHLLEQQAQLFNFLYDGCEKMGNVLVPVSDPTYLFRTMFYLQGDDVGTHTDDNGVLLAINIVEKGDVLPLTALYGEDVLPNMLFNWRFKEKRQPDNIGGVTGARFLTVELVPAAKSSKSTFTLDDESKAKKMFCAEYFKKLRTTLRVTNGTNDSLSAQFSENPLLTALYACHLTKGSE